MKNSPRDTDWQDASSAILSLKQHYAMELLLIGKSNAEVAVLIGVDSETISQWQNLDAEFIVAINALHAAAWEGSVERLRRLMEQTLDVIEKAVARGDETLALSLLLALGKENNQVASPQLEVKSSISTNRKVKRRRAGQQIPLMNVSRF